MDNSWLENMKGLHDTTIKFRVLLSSEVIKMLEQVRLLFCNIFFCNWLWFSYSKLYGAIYNV